MAPFLTRAETFIFGQGARRVSAEGAFAPLAEPSDAARLERAAREHFQFIWRCLRRFGVRPDHAVDDAVQRVFEIAARRVAVIVPGHERAFLFKIAVLVSKEARRKQATDREVLDCERIEAELDARADPEQLLEQERWRSVLDTLLEQLSLELRHVFVLYELEGLQMSEIASLLDIPLGTVASRLRRARAAFQEKGRQLRAQLDLGPKPR